MDMGIGRQKLINQNKGRLRLAEAGGMNPEDITFRPGD
jgi:hypothetical protein